MARAGSGMERAAETALVERSLAGDREAFAQLVRRYQGPLLRFLRLRARSPEDAEELAQETFLRAWSRLDRYDARWRFSTWLFTLARRLAAGRRRRAGSRASGLNTPLEPQVDADPSVALADAELGARLWGLARRVLTHDQRTALWLRYVEELDAVEIGRVLGRRPTAVRVLLHRSRATLARHLDPGLGAREATSGLRLGPLLPAEALEGGR